MSSEEENIPCTPQKLRTEAETVVQGLLPQKSKKYYEAAYEKFVQWKKENKAITSENCILIYFNEMAKKFKPTTIWSQYSMLKHTLKVKEKIDISGFHNLTAKLKYNSTGYRCKKANIFEASEVENFLQNAPDAIYLATKVILIFGLSGACRGDELVNIKIQDVVEQGQLLLVTLLETKNNKPRSFTICKQLTDIVNKYRILRPKNTTTDRMFVNYQKGKCTVQPIGKNKIASMPKEIATWLKLLDPETYTGHAYRRTAATLLANGGGTILDLKLLGGWLSDKVAGQYVENSLLNKQKISNFITSSINISELNGANSTISVEQCNSPPAKRIKGNATATSVSKTENCSPTKGMYFENCQVTINYQK